MPPKHPPVRPALLQKCPCSHHRRPTGPRLPQQQCWSCGTASGCSWVRAFLQSANDKQKNNNLMSNVQDFESSADVFSRPTAPAYCGCKHIPCQSQQSTNLLEGVELSHVCSSALDTGETSQNQQCEETTKLSRLLHTSWYPIPSLLQPGK